MITVSRKSRLIGFLLSFMFGPLGVLYANIAAGLILLLVCVFTSFTFVGPIIAWLLGILISDHMICRQNKRHDAQIEECRKNHHPEGGQAKPIGFN